jgi:hypothetical protein
MTLRNEDLIVRYFDRNMSVSEEQNFLISLAASDELRIAFRSHLELNRAIRQDKDDMRPVAQVRSRTLATLGLTAAATLPFLEQALVQSSDPVRAATTHVIPAQVTAPTVEQSSWISTLIRSTSGRFAARIFQRTCVHEYRHKWIATKHASYESCDCCAKYYRTEHRTTSYDTSKPIAIRFVADTRCYCDRTKWPGRQTIRC